MITSLTLILWATIAQEPRWRVELRNGSHVDSPEVSRDGPNWMLTYEHGRVWVPLDQVVSVEPLGTREDAPAGAPPADLESRDFELASVSARTWLPPGYAASEHTEPGVVTFVSPDGQTSVRFAWTGEAPSVWTVGRSVQAHHRSTYSGYEERSELYTLARGRPLWLLTFDYRKGTTPWRESQGFLHLAGGILVISVTTPPAAPGSPDRFVRRLATTLDLAPPAVGPPPGTTEDPAPAETKDEAGPTDDPNRR